MYRTKIEKLVEWKNNKYRKPLILRGARQVGKTWLLQEFGKNYFSNVAYVRIEDNVAMQRLFEGSLEPQRILNGIAAETSVKIEPQNTLIVLDEIQAAPRALTALKYFCEEAPEYAIAAAGSLLGIALHSGISFPIGKVSFEDLYPLTFYEFLQAMNCDSLCSFLDNNDFDMITTFKKKYIDLLKQYYFVGGMPEAVFQFSQNGDYKKVRKIQQDIINAYQGDFSKHASGLNTERCRLIFNSLPRHLARENKKFVYGLVKKGARGRDLDDALQFLIDAGLVIKTKCISAAGLPLEAYAQESIFKLYCVDVGLLGALSGLDSSAIINGNVLFTHFKGAIAEQYACQQLVGDLQITPYYWSASKSSGEVDFIVSYGGKLIPIEVKAEENLKAKSLAAFSKSNNLKNAIRLSLSNFRKESWLTNVPLYALHCLPNLM